jgi:NAD(P)H-flavin reductase
MKATTARCTRIADIGQGRTRASIESPIVPQLGQFVLARYWPGLDPYLSSVVFPAALTRHGFALELRSDDPTLPYLAPGAELHLTGPFGQPVPFRLQPNGRILLISARSPHRLLPLAQQALEIGVDITMLLEQPYPLQTLDTRIEARRGGLPALLEDHLAWAEKVFVDCLPEPELRAALQPLAGDSYALFAEALPCGTGACQGCPVKSGKGWQLACVNGPFFRLSELD